MQNSILYRMVPISIEVIMDDLLLILNFPISSLFGSNTFPVSTSDFSLQYELLCYMQNSILYRMIPISIKVIIDDVIFLLNFAFPAFLAVISSRFLSPTSIYAENCCVRCRIQFSIEWCPFQFKSSWTICFQS
jgi:hypothetical protein